MDSKRDSTKYKDTIDVFYFNSSGTFSKLSTSLTLSVARMWV